MLAQSAGWPRRPGETGRCDVEERTTLLVDAMDPRLMLGVWTVLSLVAPASGLVALRNPLPRRLRVSMHAFDYDVAIVRAQRC